MHVGFAGVNNHVLGSLGILITPLRAALACPEPPVFRMEAGITALPR